MFDSIEKMEQEIEQFRKNMLASSELVESVSNLVQETKKQQALIEKLSSEYQENINRLEKQAIDSIQTKHAEAIEVIKTCESNTAEKIEQSTAKNIQDAIVNINQNNKEYVDQLRDTCQEVKKLEDSLELKYSDFIQKLDNARVDEVCDVCHDLKRSVDKKMKIFTIAIVALGIVFFLDFILTMTV